MCQGLPPGGNDPAARLQSVTRVLGPGGLVIRSEAALSSIAEMSFLPALHWGLPNTDAAGLSGLTNLRLHAAHEAILPATSCPAANVLIMT